MNFFTHIEMGELQQLVKEKQPTSVQQTCELLQYWLKASQDGKSEYPE